MIRLETYTSCQMPLGRAMMGSTMKRKILFFVALLLLIAGAIGIFRFVSNRSGKQGELRVESQPVASIFLDNKHIGRTPYRDKITAGEYTIKLVPESAVDGTASWQGRIAVGPSLLTYINGTLSDSELTTAVDILWLTKITSRQSEISVTTNPDGATLLVDNETKGITPLSISDIAPGDHKISLASPGFASRTINIKTTAGYKLIVSVKLALSGGPIPTPTTDATLSPTISGKPTPKASSTPKPTPTKTATSSGTLQDPSKPFAIIKDTPTGFLRVREKPSTATDSAELSRVNPSEKYHIYDEQSGWYQIQYSGSSKGWISGTYAEKVE